MGLQGLVQAYSLTSLTTKEEAASVMNALTAAASKPHAKASAAGQAASTPPMLLYVTPEKIVASKRLMSKLEKLYQVWQGTLSALAVTLASSRACAQDRSVHMAWKPSSPFVSRV